MTAEVVSVGTELLLGQIVDSHAPTMAQILADCGITCVRRQTIGDNLGRIVEALREALGRADLVVTVGGLGPTSDDLTRDAIAAALDEPLVHVEERERKLKSFFAMRNLPWIESIAKQSYRPTSARFVDNPNGTAPGLICEKNGKVVIALPGPKGEFNPMAHGPIREYLEGLQGGEVIHSRILRICGMGESQVESLILDLMEGSNPSVAPYAHPGEVHLRVTARAASRQEADRMIEPLHRQIGERLGDALFGTDETTLEEAVIGLLLQRTCTLSVAESMTGGYVGERLTSIPGSSAAFLGGVIAYSGKAKTKVLGVDSAVLRDHGPVSEEAAREMAIRVRERLGATYGLSITGNAGPTSDVDDKPIGLVFIGVADESGCRVEQHRFRGRRDDVRRRATQAALVALRAALLKR